MKKEHIAPITRVTVMGVTMLPASSMVVRKCFSCSRRVLTIAAQLEVGSFELVTASGDLSHGKPVLVCEMKSYGGVP